MIRLKEHYMNVIAPDLLIKLNKRNSLDIPCLDKIILSSSADFESEQVRGVVKETNAIKKKNKKVTKSQQIKSKNQASLGNRVSIWDNVPHQVRVAIALISGQRPTERVYRKTIPGLGIRKNQLASFQTTLRKDSMYSFLDKLISEVLPNISDFKALRSEPYLRSNSD
jgi:ribosomal protein L5